MPDDDEDAVFFTVAGLGVVRHPPAISLVAVVLAGGILAAGLQRRRAWRRLLPGLGASAGTALAATMLATVVWSQLAGARSDMGVAGYLYLAGLLLLTAGTGAVAGHVAARRPGGARDPAGVVTLWWVLAAFTAATVPGIGYLFAWPALAAALALLGWRPGRGPAAGALLRLALVATVGLVLLVPAIDTFFQLAQPRPGNLDAQILPVVAVPVLLGALLVELIRPFVVRTENRDRVGADPVR